MLSILVLTLAMGAPLALAAMGGYTSERSGVINIGLEGMMLIAACMTAVVGVPYGAVAGLAAAIASAIALSTLHWLMTQKFSVNHVISGMGINALAAGGSSFVFAIYGDPKHEGGVPQLSVWIFFVIAVISPALLWLYAGRTRGGLRLVAVGADPDKSRLMGLQPLQIRFVALVATGLFCGLAGALLVSYVGVYTNNITAGKGYVALAALVVSGWRPIPALAVCLALGFFTSLQYRFQGTGFLHWIPSQAWQSLPYLLTIIALAGFLGKNRTPAGLGKP